MLAPIRRDRNDHSVDLGFLSYPIPTFAALLEFPRPPAVLILRLRSALDAAVIASGVFFVSMSTVLDSVVHSLHGIDLAGEVGLAYPIIDVVICSLVLTFGMRQPSGQRLTWLLLGAAMVALAVTDGVWFEQTAREGDAQTAGTPVVGWMAGALLVVLATWAPQHSSDQRQTRRFMRAVELIPYPPILAGVLVIVGPGAHWSWDRQHLLVRASPGIRQPTSQEASWVVRISRLVAEGIVSKLGYQVSIVANGAQALEALLSTTYSVVLMDCHMPVMDGFEGTRQIRARQDKNRAIPIIAMTAGAMMEDREACFVAGMDDYILKPVDLLTVSAVLRRWIQTPESPVQSPLDLHRVEERR